VITAAEFRMAEMVGRPELMDHPVWADFQGDRDRERILSWGVAEARLDAELAHYDYCGRSPLYPVIDLACTSDLPSPTVALRVVLPGGATAGGYRIGDRVLGVYLGDDEYCLNPNLPARARAEVERLARALGCAPDALEALRYESSMALGPQGKIHGVFGLL